MRWLSLLACAGCSTYAHRPTAIVPHTAPVQSIGQPAAWRGTASLGATNLGDFVEPGEGDPGGGIAVPSRQYRGALSYAVTRRMIVGLHAELGAASSARRISDTEPPLPDRSVFGGGGTLDYVIETGTPFHIGVAAELTGWEVPYVAHTTCLEGCTKTQTVMTEGTATAFTFAIGIVPSYQLADWTFFAGTTLRNHPLVEDEVINHADHLELASLGPPNVLVHAGLAYEVADRVQLVIEMHDELLASAVDYATGVGFSVVVGLGPRYPDATHQARPSPLPPARGEPLAPPLDPFTERRTRIEELTRAARSFATQGDCTAVAMIALEVEDLDPEHYELVFQQDVLIARCAFR